MDTASLNTWENRHATNLSVDILTKKSRSLRDCQTRFQTVSVVTSVVHVSQSTAGGLRSWRTRSAKIESVRVKSRQRLAVSKQGTRKADCIYPEPAKERSNMLDTYRVNGASYGDSPCIHQLIERQVDLRRDAIALLYEEQTITYAELNARANRIAHRLIELGVLPDDRVALCVSRSPAMIIGMLAILKAGGAYAPIDPVYSSARSERILGDVCPKILLSDKIGRATLNEDTIDALTVIDPNMLPNLPTCNPRVPQLNSKHLSHVTYTSGSTGLPKGVMVEHRNIVRALSGCELWFNFDPNDTWSLLQSISSGFGLWTLWGSLGCGAQMVIVSHEISRSPIELHRLVCDKKITILSLTPSVLRLYIAQYCREPRADNLRHIVIAGERFNSEMLRSWFALRDDDSPRVINCYGATEMSLFPAAKLLEKGDADSTISPVGRPSFDSTIYLLDDDCFPVPNGEAGEICVDAGGIARGYLNRDDLTSKRFLANPFSEAFDGRMYRSGDMAYHRADGTLAFVGRNDEQFKIRGFRIEPCEVETCLIAHPAVRQAHVLVVSSKYLDRLVAYVVAEHVHDLQVTLYEHAVAQLPQYMVPSAFVVLEELPLNQSGKIDRSALPKPDETTFPRRAFEEPQGVIEEELAKVWGNLLELDRVGRWDSFFAIGGHSLIVAHVIEHMRSLGWNLTISNLFQHPILFELATTVTRYENSHVPPPSVIVPNLTLPAPESLTLIDLSETDIVRIIEKVPGGIDNIQDIYDLSPLQNGILFHYLLNTENDPYVIRTGIEFADKHILESYLIAFQRMIDRHDILRTSFVWDGISVPAQVVWHRAQLSVTETSLDVDMDIIGNPIRWLDSRDFRINLEQAPLVRFVITRTNSGGWIMLQIMHHLIADDITIRMMHIEMQAHLSGQRDLPQPSPYHNLISRMRLTVDHDACMQFFTEMLSDVDASTLPFELRELHVNELENAQSQLTLDPTLMHKLRHAAKNFNVSLATLCHLAWAVIISRACDQTRVVFGTVLLGRMQMGTNVASAMGLYVNTLPLRLDVDDTPVVETLHRTVLTLARLLEYEYASLVLIQRCSSIVSSAPLFSSLLNVRNHLSTVDPNQYPAGITFHGTVGYTHYPLVLMVDYSDSGVVLTAQVKKPICSERVCGYMQRALESLNETLERTPHSPVRCLEILPKLEKTLLLETWSDAEKLEPDDNLCIHQIFERQVHLAANAIALIFGEHETTYGELNIRANRLAHQLIALGLVPEERVAFCLDRTPDMIVCILAILKAGGVYVPIDPAYACERVLHILSDAGPKIILADQIGRGALVNIDIPGITILDLVSGTEFPDVNPMIPRHNSMCLAYIIYTSGSTGMPKGVMIEHRNIVRLFHATEDLFHFDSTNVWCLNHSIAFDVSMWEVWGALRSGSRIVIVPHNVSRSARELERLICQQHVTILNSTPSAFGAFCGIRGESPTPNKLQFVIFAGEKLEPSVLNSWYAVHDDTRPRLINMYGTTETTIHATYRALTKQDADRTVSPIGKRLPCIKLYLLDANGQPVPLGAVGQIHLGGIGIGRGYLNRLELTNDRFIADPFSSAFDARMYRTGDIAYYLADGNLAYVSRNDQQVKIRGFRVELGEIEACISNHPFVNQVRVFVVNNNSVERLVAYVLAKSEENLTISLREHVSCQLPEYMVPSAFVTLDEFPLTKNGKLDRSALPALERTVFAHQAFEAPQGPVEIELANIWSKLLGLEKVGRHDSFFALGGHSLLAVQVSQHLRTFGWSLTVRDLFDHPVLSQLAAMVERYRDHNIPLNVITPDTKMLTPDMLPLIDLTQSDIDRIIDKVPGGVENIQDIYAVSPLQDGILFHHLLTPEYDLYHFISQVAFTDRNLLDRYLSGFQYVVERHDIFRTSLIAEGLSRSAQVVWRNATISVVEIAEAEETHLASELLFSDSSSGKYRIDLEKAPLLRFVIIRDAIGRWILNEIIHHLIMDHTTVELMHHEVREHMSGRQQSLSEPIPFRNFIAAIGFENDKKSHEQFFRRMLQDIREPTLPYGIVDIFNSSSRVMDSHRMLSSKLNDALRNQVRTLGVSLASVFHLAFGIMISRTCCHNHVVFGTVLYGRTKGSIGDGSAMGLFLNTLPVRIDIDEMTVHECLNRTHKLLAELLDHEHGSLVLAQRCSSLGVNEPLFSALLNYRHNTSYIGIGDTIPGVEVIRAEERTNYPLVLAVEDYQSALGITVQTVSPISPQRLLNYMQRTIENLKDALDQIDGRTLRSIEMMPDTERIDLIETRNHTERSYPDPPCIHHIFEQQARQLPNATAIVHVQRELTYAELNHRANKLAHHLIDLGISKDDRVALCVERSAAMIIGILAIFKAGAAYVPMDPAHSSQRSSYILNDAGPKIALVDDVGRVAFSNVALTQLKLIDPNAPSESSDVSPVSPTLRSDNIAYIIYTSGTTGKSKGVMVQHRNVVRLLGACEFHFQFDQRDTWCLFHSIAFDFSVWELWGALCHGSKLVIIPEDISRSPEELHKLVWEQGVTVMNFTPNAFREFAKIDVSESKTQKLRYIIFGGEKLDCYILKSWYATHSGTSPQLVNMYGITETTVHATYRPLNQRNTTEKKSIIGRRLPHNKIYVLDSERRPVPVGVVGEIHMGGAGVTSGYLNREDLTNDRFLSDPFSDAFDARMYRTGDLAYYLENSELAYVGRNDEQVKVRGFRIEVGEIENCLVEHSLVRQALVRVIKNQEFDNLVAYVITDAVQNLNVELREYASVHLPEYMVPSAFVRLDKLPLTQNGKIDYSALPLPDETAYANQSYEEPCSPLEIELATIWRNLLKIDRVGRQDSFFALGGHSLLAVRVIEQLRAQGWKLSVRDLFNHPILYVLANSITKYQERQIPPNVIGTDTRVLTPDMLPLIELSQSEIDSIVNKVPGGVGNVQDIYALSPLQEGILFHNLLASGDDPYLVSNFMRFTDRKLLDHYLGAFQCMIDRHDILRTAFAWKDLSVPVQVVWRRAMFAVSEVTLTPQQESVYDQFRSNTLDPRSHGIDLETAPLVRFVLTRDGSGGWLVCQQTHHLIGDQTTIRSMSAELRAQMTGTELPSSTPYRNLVHTMRIGSSKEATIRFFSEMLRDIESPTLPFRLYEVHTNHSQITMAQQKLASDSMMRLRSETRNVNVGVATLIHVAWALVLSRVCDQRQVVFGTVLFGRMHTERGSASAMGLYINTLPLRVDIDDSSVGESIHKVHNGLAELLEHEHASLVLAQRCSSIPSGQPLFSSLLNFRHHQAVDGSMYPPGIQSIEVVGHTNYPLNISIDDDENALRLSTETIRPADPNRICMYMQQAVNDLIDSLSSKPAIPVKSLEVLPWGERALLLEKWNEVEAQIDLPCIHQLFEQQVSRMRNAIAIVSGSEEISYAELNIRVNELAHRLIKVGVSPGECVGLCVSRSPTMIVGVIAILKAGGAYVPIDPDHASSRLSHILNDANPSIVLADECGRKVLNDIDSATFMILDPDITSDSPHTNPLISELDSKNLAYIIYTSGTTGKPKGVMVQHGNIVRLFSATDSLFHFTSDDTWCLYHSIAFDVSVWEVWGSLSKGAKLIIVSRDVARSPRDMWRILSEHQVTTLNLTPSAFSLMKNYATSRNSLRYIILGGEKLESRILQSWYLTHDNITPQLVNMYGNTETTVQAMYRPIVKQDVELTISPIGKKLSDNRIYLLDFSGKPVPLGATGEVHIGGAGVTSGYLNRYDLTAERFLSDSFSDAFDTKMYRTGDLAYQLENGELVYVGRKDQQIKVRGFRIEPSEIEVCLISHPNVCQALVRVVSDGEFDRLIAYVKAEISDNLIIELREYASTKLPEYMVPSAFVVVDEFPLNQNGKIDYSALPSVSSEAFASQAYEEPRGELEIELAEIWSETLEIERVGRNDSFFALGGHSLLAMRLIERLSVRGWALKVRDLFDYPVLWQLAQIITRDQRRDAPPNIIESSTTMLTPDMLPLIDLTQSDIDTILSEIPGGVTNIQDIYALSPLQEGILFHNLLSGDNDPYVGMSFIEFDDRSWLDRYLDAVQCMVNRHDILRTSFTWKNVLNPAQVVWRRALLSITEDCVSSDDNSIYDEFKVHCSERRQSVIHLETAPLIRFEITRGNSGRWLACQFMHHLIGDATTLQTMYIEMEAHLNDGNLPDVTPYRNLVHSMRTRTNEQATTRFFTEMLREIENPTLPFGLDNVYIDGAESINFEQQLAADLTIRLRTQTRNLNVTVATLFHVAWGLVLSRICDQRHVVFGTVLSGRMHSEKGSDTAMGLYINTLPLRVSVDSTPVESAVRKVHNSLADLLEYEHASLIVAQRCSAIPTGQSLFSSLLNFTQQPLNWNSSYSTGIHFLESFGNTNFPVNVSIRDEGNTLYLTCGAARPVAAERLCAYIRTALENLVDVGNVSSLTPLHTLEVLHEDEHKLTMELWNTTETHPLDFPCIHELFERQVLRTPDAIALEHEDRTMSYAELNKRANRLAHELMNLGVSPGKLVGLCTGRTLAMITSVLAILKAGGTYVPVDPAYAGERSSYILDDANPHVVLADEEGRKSLRSIDLAKYTILDPNIDSNFPETNPKLPKLSSTNLAYIIYTSGTTGQPKGVMVQHRNIVGFLSATDAVFQSNEHDVWCLFHSIAFDPSVWETWGPLSKGGKLIIVSRDTQRDVRKLKDLQGVTIFNLVPSTFGIYATAYEKSPLPETLRFIILGGEKIESSTLRSWFCAHGSTSPRLVNVYGATEATIVATYKPLIESDAVQAMNPIGKKLSDGKIYLLDSHGRPVPLGAVGEIYNGGPGVTSGYLNRLDLTSERFLQDPFSESFDARMYRTGDLARYLENGDLLYMGRNDQQVKIRGFRIELSEIESCLASHPVVRGVFVLAVGENDLAKLVAYVTSHITENNAEELREYALSQLPDYMVPARFVFLDELPLNQNGKIDRTALPTLDMAAFSIPSDEEPRGIVEIELAEIWSEMLEIDKISRNDSFFALGGHSLLAVRLIERLSVRGWQLKVRDLFYSPVLSQLAETITQVQKREVPPNRISLDSTVLTPDMLPLIELSQSDIDIIVSKIPGGIANIQDIYALSPLQEGLLFHNLLAGENDPYLSASFMEFDDRSWLDRYVDVLQCMVNRHDILRTSFVCETVSAPAQVVWRQASLSITEVSVPFEDTSINDEFRNHCFNRQRCYIDLATAPLVRLEISRGNSGHWLACQFSHHLIGDAMTLRTMYMEIQAHLSGANLPSVAQYRNFVHFMRTKTSERAIDRFFTGMLHDIASPTLPFGLNEVYVNHTETSEFEQQLVGNLSVRLRTRTRSLNIGVATMIHVAWALVLSRICNQRQVVFGTVLSGRMHTEGSSDAAMGLYINTLPLRVDVDDTPVESAVRKVHNSLADLLEYEHASLAVAQRCSSIPSGQTLFSSLLNFGQQPLTWNSSYSTGIYFLESFGTTNFPVNITIRDDGSALYVACTAARPVDTGRLFAYIRTALENLVDLEDTTASMPLHALEILPENEHKLMMEIWNTMESQPPDSPCIHELFEQQVLQTPHAIALVYENETISYAELNSRANQLAHELMDSGISPGKLVGLCIGRSPAMIVGVLAILKAGGAYVPVDPAYACERLSYIFDDANPRVILADGQGRKSLRSIDLEKSKIVDPNIESNFPKTNPSIPELCSTNLAYVIYTSGTTGKPKGVMVQHRNIVRLFSATDPWFSFDANDTWCLYHSIAFDVSVWEIWGCLSKGARLIIVSHNVSRSPEDLWNVIRQQNVSVLNLTPSAFKLLSDNDFSTNGLRYIILAGEKLEHSTLQRWYSKYGGTSPQLVNMYGPTETTIYATYGPLTVQDAQLRTNPIGRKLSHNKIYLLDAHTQPVPLRAIGEMYVGGICVACGYLNRRDLTEERFVRDPFSDAFGARMYRTGDCAYYLDSGELIFVGRNDEQIKIRGFRVEPSEIEACLISHPGVKEALVCMEGNDELSRLVAYVIGQISENPSAELREYASMKLPEYMVPSAFIMIEEFPLTQNGKIDRSALPASDQKDLSTLAYEEPQTVIEIELARIWGELLYVDRVGRRDSFFALGGNSLHAVRMTERMKSIGWKLNVRDLFDHPILFELANGVVQHQVREVPPNVLSPDVTKLTPEMFPLIDLTQSDIDKIISEVPGGVSNIQDIYALSPLQDGLLFHNLLAPENDPYNLICRMSFTVRDQLDRYLSAIQLVVDRHDILRTAFIWKGITTPAQVVWRVAKISVENMTEPFDNLSPSVPNSTSLPDLQLRSASLNRAPLLRYLVVRETSGRWTLTELFHHLIMDHSSIELVHREILAFLDDENTTLPEPSPFRNFIAEVKFGADQKVHERFFSEMLADISEPTMPYGVFQIYQDGSEVTESSELFSRELNKRLRDSARKLNVSLTTIFHVAYAVLISITSGRSNVVFGTVLFGRMKTDVRSDSTLGFFINTLPVRVNIDETPIRRSLQQTHNLLARLFDHEHASLTLARRCSGIENGIPLFTALLNYRHNKSPSVQPSVIPGMEFLTAEERTNFPVIISIEDFGTQLGLTTQVVYPINSERFRSYMQQAVVCIADALEQPSDTSIRSIDVLTCEDRAELLERPNLPENEYADLCCIHRYFERQAERRPEATALLYTNQKMTYAELNSRANRLAQQLIDLGVTNDERVALCVERCPAMIVGVLAILKSGAAYVPLDPAYSSERSLYVLNDTAPRIAIVDHVGRGVLGDTALSKLIVLDPEPTLLSSVDNPVLSRDDSKNLAYIIYTSGSTGKPKGVMVEHRNVVRFCRAADRWFDFDHHDTWCTLSSIAFDVSVWELFGCLFHGAKLIIVPRDVVRSPQELHNLVSRQNVTVVNFTPNVFYAFIDHYVSHAVPDQLRYVVLAGDKVKTLTLRPWFAIRGDISPQLVILYGTTETTVCATCKFLKESDAESTVSPIGTRIVNNTIYILNDHRRPLPMGVVGEIYIGGSGVARGLLNREDLSHERYLADPFSDAFDARMYRTGDLAHHMEDGGLAFVGRNDGQVKIRGFRIEPSEVEICLVQHPAVHRAHVCVVSTESIDRLVAYIVANKTRNLIDILRQHVKSQLPEYMVPSAFIQLSKFPLTPNGKIDVRSLPAPTQQDFATNSFETPRGTIEMIVASTWGQLLGIDSVGRRDDFFALGGHSILAIRMMSLLAYRGLMGTLNDLFQCPVLADFALKISPDVCMSSVNAAVIVRSIGTEPPLFCAPTGFGDFSYAFALSSYIRSSCPIFALPWPSFRDTGMQDIQELAAYAIDLMRTVQPQGPYRVCGYSGGGILAYCVAATLLHAGETVSFVGLIDTPAPSTFDNIPPLSANDLLVYDLSGKWGSNYTDEIEIIRNQKNVLDLIQCIELAQQMKLYPANVSPESVAERLRQPLVYAQMIRRYKPEQLPITIHMFRAIGSPSDDTRMSKSSDDLEDISFGWSLVVPNSLLRILPVHGDHLSIVVDRENRISLCQGLCAALDSQ